MKDEHSTDEKTEQFEFEALVKERQPIRGYPELRWAGKRPFRATQYYPAQLKEQHGPAVPHEHDGKTSDWRNKLYWGDNLQVMSHLLKEFRGKINLIYIDPPFDSKAEYKKKIQLKGKTIENDQSAFEEKQYTDIWNNDEYLQFMYERLILMRELLAENGSIFVHCDHRRSHHLRCILDEIYGCENFRNEITREKCNPKNYTNRTFGNIADVVLFYSKTQNPSWNILLQQMSSDEILESFPKVDAEGKRYKTAPLHAPGVRSGETGKPWRGLQPPHGNHWRYIHKTLDELDAAGLIEWSGTGNPRKIIYEENSKGTPVQDIWLGMKDPSGVYPTEKNGILLERIIKASSNPGDIVFDCFMGSGTTQAVAMKLGRRFIGADINLGAVQITTKRLLKVAEELKQQDAQQEMDLETEADGEQRVRAYYTGFEVYTVNHYDVFRNPVQAKELLIEALEIQPLRTHGVYDGEKDGRMVKIMPINRIATRADLGQLVDGFDRRTFDRRRQENPRQPVEKLLLVCMGHEPDLKATLEMQMLEEGYRLDIEVVDILRQKAELEFKREAEVKVGVHDGYVEIEAFYPMNLLQKLSLFKENVEDWKTLVEMVMVDFNYDGAVFTPTVVDCPEGTVMVKGRYAIPEDAGTIRVKITDLLSESLEVEVER